MASKATYQLNVLLGASTTSSFHSNINRAANGIESLNSTAAKVAAGIAAAFAAVNITQAIEGAVDTYMEFEQEMATVTAIAQATRSEFEMMEAASLAAGRSTIYTAAEAASALEYMALAGWDVETSIRAQTPILRLAAATQKDLATTSDLVTDSMSALGLEVDGLDGYLNKLVAGNNKANTSAEQLMQSLVKSGGAARTLGADLDDTITAAGILANNGVKGDEAGAALNSIFTRIAANSTATKELNRIGVSIFDESGTFIGLEESLVAINEAMEDFTDEQKTKSLERIAGTERYSQFAYLLDAARAVNAETGVTEWQTLENEIINSGGSLINMYNTTTDTLLNAQAILNSAKEDIQIRIVDVFSDDAKNFTLWLAEKLPEATDSIVAFADAHRGDFADALETAGELLEGVWDVGVEAGTWLIDHKGAVVGTLTAIGTVLGARKLISIGTGLASIVSGLAAMGPVGWIIGGVATAAGVLVGVLNAIEQANERMAAESLAEHFGNISLSLEEIDSLARQIVGKGSIGGVAELMDSISESASTMDRVTDILQDLQKGDWKIEVGFDMTTDDYEDYASQIESYISGVEEYATNKGYEVHLATSLLFGAGSLQDEEIGSFYASLQEQLEGYGTDLYNYLYDEVSGAMLDGIIDPFENGKIQEKLEEINHITSAITEAENAARFDSLTLQYNGADLDDASREKLMEDLAQYTSEVQKGAQEAYQSTMTSNYARLELDEDYTQEDFEKDKEAALLAYHKMAEEAAINSSQYMVDMLNNSYTELPEIIQRYQAAQEAAMDKWMNPDQALWDIDPVLAMFYFRSEMFEGMNASIDKKTRLGMLEYVEDMSPTMAVLEKEAEEILNAGGKLDQETQNILSYWNLIRDIANMNDESAEHALDDILAPGGRATSFLASYGYSINEDYGLEGAPYLTEAYKNMLPERGRVTWEDKEIMENITRKAHEIYNETANALEEAYEQGFDVETDIRVEFAVNGQILSNDLNKPVGSVASVEIARNADGGIYDHPILTTFAEEGPEAALPLDGSPRAKSLWIQAGEILGMLPKGKTRDQRLLEGISGMGNGSRASGHGDIKIEFNPVITIQGNADRGEVQKAVSLGVNELKEMLNDIMRERERTGF